MCPCEPCAPPVVAELQTPWACLQVGLAAVSRPCFPWRQCPGCGLLPALPRGPAATAMDSYKQGWPLARPAVSRCNSCGDTRAPGLPPSYLAKRPGGHTGPRSHPQDRSHSAGVPAGAGRLGGRRLQGCWQRVHGAGTVGGDGTGSREPHLSRPGEGK